MTARGGLSGDWEPAVTGGRVQQPTMKSLVWSGRVWLGEVGWVESIMKTCGGCSSQSSPACFLIRAALIGVQTAPPRSPSSEPLAATLGRASMVQGLSAIQKAPRHFFVNLSGAFFLSSNYPFFTSLGLRHSSSSSSSRSSLLLPIQSIRTASAVRSQSTLPIQPPSSSSWLKLVCLGSLNPAFPNISTTSAIFLSVQR